jgi:phage protein D
MSKSTTSNLAFLYRLGEVYGFIFYMRLKNAIFAGN